MHKEIQKNWHYLWLEVTSYGWKRIIPLINIHKDSFDLLWLGFQITWRYIGNARESITGIRVKDYDKIKIHSSEGVKE